MSLKRTAETKWANATIQDNFVFSKTMELYPDLCRQLLELILNVKIKEISYPEREKTIEARIDGKGIRLDVFVEDKGAKRSFDVEMQVTNSAHLDMRIRYYQGLIDMNSLKRGQHYSALNESFIIFICPFDHFKQGRHFYSFSERCDQDTNLKLNNKTHHIFLSTKGTADDVSPDILAFLNYVDNGVVSGKFVEKLDAAVYSVKSNQKVRHDFMTLQMALLEERMESEMRGEQRGLAQGIELGRNEEREALARNLIRRGRRIQEIHEDTGLSVERIEQLFNNTPIT